MRVVIVGAGLAGAATAWALTARGVRDVVVCEREAVPGAHASGHSAAMSRRLEPDPVLAALAREGAGFCARPPAGFATAPLLRPTGGLLLAGAPALGELDEAAEQTRAAGVAVEQWSAAHARARVPAVAGAPPLAGWHCADDGVIDVHALLSGFLAAARAGGATVRLGCAVASLRMRGGRVCGVTTPDGDLAADVVIDAAGAWAGRLLAAAGGTPPPLQPLRRHLFVIAGGPVAGRPAAAVPWVWDLTHGCYVRPEPGGLLASPCDEDPAEAGDAPPAPDAAERLARAIAVAFPALAGARLVRAWAGLRTFAPDRRPVIGWDPDWPGLFYVAALGGFGVTTAAAVGARAADRLLAGPRTPVDDPLAPGRYTASACSSRAAASSPSRNGPASPGDRSPASAS